MHGIIASLKKSNIFTSINVIELIDEESVRLLKVRATVFNRSVLYITELNTSDFQKYSYHWQEENGKLIIRWDNKPHWKHLKTFPHHKHENEKVFSSKRVSVEDVIEEIKKNSNYSSDQAED